MEEEVKIVKEGEPQENAGKDHKKFEQVVEQIMALLNGDESVLKIKVPNSKIGDLMSKLTEKRNTAAIEKFSTEFDALLDKYVLFKRDCTAKRKEMEDAVGKKEKEFTQEANKVLGQLENMGKYLGEYKAALAAAAGGNNQV